MLDKDQTPFPQLDDFPSDNDLPLRERVADLLAGDLDPASAQQLQTLIDGDSNLQAEAAFWRTIQQQLPSAAHPSEVRPPGAGMAALLKQRLASEARPATHGAGSTRAKVMSFPKQWLPWSLAVAALLTLGIFLAFPPAPFAGEFPVIYDEFGAAVEDRGNRHGGPQMVSRSAADSGNTSASGTLPIDHPEDRVWMGIWTKPIALQGFSRSKGLLLVRVAEQGPAALAGLRAGDVILEVESMATSTRWCIPAALSASSPQEMVTVTYWREGFAEPRRSQLQLGRCWE